MRAASAEAGLYRCLETRGPRVSPGPACIAVAMAYQENCVRSAYWPVSSPVRPLSPWV